MECVLNYLLNSASVKVSQLLVNKALTFMYFLFPLTRGRLARRVMQNEEEEKSSLGGLFHT